MKFTIPLLLAVLSKETQSRSPTSLWNRLPDRQSGQRLGRLLQENLCTFDAFVAGDCTYEEFCRPSEPNSAISCQGLPTSTWIVEVVYFESCFESLDDFEGVLANASVPVPPDGYCSTERGLFTFTQEVLTSVSLNQTITAPYQSAILEEYNVVACPDSALPDFVFGASYCYDGCPVAASIDGTTCTGACTICEDGAGLLNCSNLDPTLVYSCSGDFEDDDIYEQLFTFLGQADTPDASPVAPPPPAEQPNSSTREPVQPVAPSPTAVVTSSGIATGGFAMTAFALALHAVLFS